MEDITLLDFINDAPDGQAVLGFYTSVGQPTGEEIHLNDLDWTTPFDNRLETLYGGISDGQWHWTGGGFPTDWNGNSVQRLEAWYTVVAPETSHPITHAARPQIGA